MSSKWSLRRDSPQAERMRTCRLRSHKPCSRTGIARGSSNSPGQPPHAVARDHSSSSTRPVRIESARLGFAHPEREPQRPVLLTTHRKPATANLRRGRGWLFLPAPGPAEALLYRRTSTDKSEPTRASPGNCQSRHPAARGRHLELSRAESLQNGHGGAWKAQPSQAARRRDATLLVVIVQPFHQGRDRFGNAHPSQSQQCLVSLPTSPDSRLDELGCPIAR